MNPKYVTLSDIEIFHLVFRGYRSHDGMGFLFRGQADASWDLLPKAGRKEFLLPDNRDLGRAWAWGRQAVAYCSLPSSDLEQLAIAQHHGLATRLLDWTMNPLVACFFACFDQVEKDGAIYICETPNQVVSEDNSVDDLKRLSGVFAYFPKSINPRVLNQKGICTVHCPASRKIEVKESRLGNGDPNLIVLIIPAKLKEDVLKHLEDYGIDQSVLFPDLDGLSAHINRKTLRMRKPA
jgi:hypothetical protein